MNLRTGTDDLRIALSPRFRKPDSRYTHVDSRYRTGHTNNSSDIRGTIAARAEDALKNTRTLYREADDIGDITKMRVFEAFQIISEHINDKNMPDEQAVRVRLLEFPNAASFITPQHLSEVVRVIRTFTQYASLHPGEIAPKGNMASHDILTAFIAHIEKNAAHLEVGKKLRKKFLSVPSVREVE